MAGTDQTFTCETCNKVHDSREQLREHIIIEHEGNSVEQELTFTCETCNTTFTSQEGLKQHSIKEHEGRQ
jgi:transcription elongation factor Elf1